MKEILFKFITLISEIKHQLWAQFVVKLKQARENSVKEVIINYLYICLVMSIDAM